jgi:hypothetical protein
MPGRVKKWTLRELKRVLNAREGERIVLKGIDRVSRCPWMGKNREQGN